MRRRDLLLASAPLLSSSAAWGGTGMRNAWLGTWHGVIVFHRSLPLVDVYPPPTKAHVETDDRSPIGFEVTLAATEGLVTVRTRIDGGPMQTGRDGETLSFARLPGGSGQVAQAQPDTATALLTVHPDAVGTEALLQHSDGSFWRRHINLRFFGDRAEVIVWVFDAEGTRARTWRGEALRLR